MRHLLVCLALLVSGATYVGPPPQKDVKVEKRPYIEITKGGGGKFRFFVRKGDGTLLGWSAHEFATDKAARTAIAEFKQAVTNADIRPKMNRRRIDP